MHLISLFQDLNKSHSFRSGSTALTIKLQNASGIVRCIPLHSNDYTRQKRSVYTNGCKESYM